MTQFYNNTTHFMDYDLLVYMLENYKRLYIEDMRKERLSEEAIQHIVDTDIGNAIAWARNRAEYDAKLTAQFDFDADAGLNDADNNDL